MRNPLFTRKDQLAEKRHPASLLLSNRLDYRDPLQSLIEGRDEGLMVTVRLMEALRQHHSSGEFGKNLSAFEIYGHRKPDQPLWKLLTIPSVPQTTSRWHQKQKQGIPGHSQPFPPKGWRTVADDAGGGTCPGHMEVNDTEAIEFFPAAARPSLDPGITACPSFS